MPTYEFRTPDGSIIERIFKISELPDGSVATRIISGGAGLLFKGSGFYITDYGKDGKKDQRAPSPSSGSPSSSSSASNSGGSSSDSKPASSSTPKAE